MGGGTHPFAQWSQQKVTDKQRYATLIDRTQWWGRQMLIYGVHVHVGIEDRAKVLPISRAMLTVFAHIQSLSASSPFWGGKDTGYASNRALLFQQLPTAGLPFRFDDWSQLEQYVGDMMHTGVIDQFDEVRWDVRPSPRFGTLEMRIADGATNLLEVPAISALTHCFVEHFSTLLDRGETLADAAAVVRAGEQVALGAVRHGRDHHHERRAATRSSSPTRSAAGSSTSRRSPSGSAAPPSSSRCARSCGGARPTSGSAPWPGVTRASSTPSSASLVAELQRPGVRSSATRLLNT